MGGDEMKYLRGQVGMEEKLEGDRNHICGGVGVSNFWVY